MAVADLQESQAACILCHGFVDDAEGARDAARNGPKNARSGPGHAFEDLAAAVVFRVGVVGAGCHWLISVENWSPTSIQIGVAVVLFPASNWELKVGRNCKAAVIPGARCQVRSGSAAAVTIAQMEPR